MVANPHVMLVVLITAMASVSSTFRRAFELSLFHHWVLGANLRSARLLVGNGRVGVAGGLR